MEVQKLFRSGFLFILTAFVLSLIIGGAACADDIYEENDSFEEAAPVRLQYEWIDATTGTNAGITGDDAYVEIPMGFD